MANRPQLLKQAGTLTPEQLASMTELTVEARKAARQRYEGYKVTLG